MYLKLSGGVKCRGRQRIGRRLVCMLLTLASASVLATSTDYSLLMPRAASSLLLDVAAAGERLVAVGERGHILYSDDQGASWTQARVPTSVMLTRVFFADDGTGWAVGHDGNILTSRDAGLNWELQRDGVTGQLQINEDRVGRASQRVVELRNNSGADGGEESADMSAQLEDAEQALEVAQEIMAEPVYAPPLMDAWFSNEGRGWASGGFGMLLHTTNGGRTWEDFSYKVGNDEELHLNGVVAGPDGTLYLASEWGIVFRSECEGEDWQAVESGYDGSFFGLVVNPASGSVFAYGLLGTIFRSTDQGKTWEEIDSTASSSLFGATGTADGVLVFVGLGGTAVASIDDGESFFQLEDSTGIDFYGVVAVSRGEFLAVGDGGSARLTSARIEKR